MDSSCTYVCLAGFTGANLVATCQAGGSYDVTPTCTGPAITICDDCHYWTIFACTTNNTFASITANITAILMTAKLLINHELFLNNECYFTDYRLL